MSKYVPLRQRMSDAGQRVTIHWLVADPAGPIVSNGVTLQGIGQAPGGRFVCACDHARRPGEGFHCTGETHAVTCSQCIATDAFAEHYTPRPGVAYENIPAEHRAAIEVFEAKQAIEDRQTVLAKLSTTPPEGCAHC